MTKEQVIAILNSDYCRQIRFSFRSVVGTNVTVGPESFRRVAVALQNNVIQFSNAEMPAGVRGNAAYNPERNIFLIPESLSRNTAFAETGVVHEAVHASFDLTRSIIPTIDNETAAFLAEAIYADISPNPHVLLLTHFRQYSFLFSIAEEYSPILGHIPDQKVNELRQKISTIPTYCNQIWEGTGKHRRYRIDHGSG